MGQLRRTISGALKKSDVVPTSGSVASGTTMPVYSGTTNPNSGTTSTSSKRRKSSSSKKNGYK